MVTKFTHVIFAVAMLSGIGGMATSVNTVKFEEDEGMSMFLRRATRAEFERELINSSA